MIILSKVTVVFSFTFFITHIFVGMDMLMCKSRFHFYIKMHQYSQKLNGCGDISCDEKVVFFQFHVRYLFRMMCYPYTVQVHP